MPLPNYGVLKGRPLRTTLATGQNPHYQIEVVTDDGTHYRIAINVQSQDGSEVEYVVSDDFQHPITAKLQFLPASFTHLRSESGGQALDFIRGNLFDRQQMRALPALGGTGGDDLNDELDKHISQAIADPDAIIYAFGDTWPTEHKPDKIFGFFPGNGIHDIHMNQGNPEDGRHQNDNGVWQDGGLILQFPHLNRWVAIFLKFQTQTWHTDDSTGNPLDTSVPEAALIAADTSTAAQTPAPAPISTPASHPSVTPGEPDLLIQIVALLPNGDQSRITLINVTPQPIDLTGWSLLDGHDVKYNVPARALDGGNAIAFNVALDPRVFRDGSTLLLLNKDGLKVDGVSFTSQQIQNQGWTVVF